MPELSLIFSKLKNTDLSYSERNLEEDARVIVNFQ